MGALGSYGYTTEEVMSIGYMKGTLEDKMKDRENDHFSDDSLITKKEHVKDAVKYVSKCHGNLMFHCKSSKVYQWEGYGAEQYVLMEDIDDEFLHNRIHMYLERVSESEIRTFGEMIKTIENEQPVKEDLTLTLEQARVFHEKTNKGTPLRSVCRQVEKELEKYNIEFDIDNEDILAEIITRSIQRFHVSSRTSLDLDVSSGYFKEVLKEREIGILVKWMAYLYTDNLFKIDERLSSYLSARDYRMTYGSGNASLQKISEGFEESARIMQFKYDLEDWTEVRGGIGDKVILSFCTNESNTHTIVWEDGKITEEDSIVIATSSAIKEFNIPADNRIGKSTEGNRVEALNGNWLLRGYDYPKYFSKPSKGDYFKVNKECSFQVKEHDKTKLQKDKKEEYKIYGDLFS